MQDSSLQKVPHPLFPLLSHPTFTMLALIACCSTQIWIAAVLEFGHITFDLLVFQLFGGFSPALFRDITGKWTPEQNAAFKHHFVLDYAVHPTMYTIFCLSFASLEISHSKTKFTSLQYSFILLLCMVAGTCDIIENYYIYPFADAAVNATDHAIRVSNLAAFIKWIFLVPNLAILIYIFYTRKTAEKAKVGEKKTD